MSAKTMYISKDSSTVMKGLAIIAVIISHLPRVINFPSFIKSMLHPLGYLGVAVFLCLSGYGCAMSIIRGGGQSRLKHFWKKRLNKIMPELAIAVIVTAVIKTLFLGQGWPLWEVLLNAFGLSSTIGRVTWYITYILLCYFLLSIIGVMQSRNTVVLYAISSCLVLLFTIQFDIPSLGTDMWGINAFSFQIGVLWAQYNDRICEYLDKQSVRNYIRYLNILVFCFLGLFFFCYFVLGNPTDRYLHNTLKSTIAGLFSVGCLYCSFILTKYWNRFSNLKRYLRIVGSYSYELFLVHGIIIYQFSLVFEMGLFSGIFVFFVITICSATALHYFPLWVTKYIFTEG